MSRKKISTTVYITPEQNERLHLLHTRTKVPVAVYIREGIDLVLKRYEHALPGQMSLTEVPKRSRKKDDVLGDDPRPQVASPPESSTS